MPIEDEAARRLIDRPRNQKALTIRADGVRVIASRSKQRCEEFLRSSGHETRPRIEARHHHRAVWRQVK